VAIVKCKECGNEISTGALICPKCAKPSKLKSNVSALHIFDNKATAKEIMAALTGKKKPK
jgi:predicted amidophosphoribosyltransferase